MGCKMTSNLVWGVGINDADYVVAVNETLCYIDGKRKIRLIWECPFYRKWKGVLRRCYSDKLKAKQPTYKDASICEEWHLFSTFKFWMEQQDWENKHLDKDLLLSGNKVYSPETCVFVSGLVNTFVIERGADRGQWMIGVYWHQRDQKFVAQCSNPFTKKNEGLGRFVDELEAHKAWLDRKLEHAYALAAMQTDERVAKALVDRYTDYIVV